MSWVRSPPGLPAFARLESEGCRDVAQRAKSGYSFRELRLGKPKTSPHDVCLRPPKRRTCRTLLCGRYVRSTRAVKETQCRRGSAHFEICAVDDQNLRRFL